MITYSSDPQSHQNQTQVYDNNYTNQAIITFKSNVFVEAISQKYQP